MKKILDVCCGGRMFWFDKKNKDVLFLDRRVVEPVLVGNGRNARMFECKPDKIMDFRKLQFPSGSFKLVVFDPPHFTSLGKSSYMNIKYGTLDKNTWREDLRSGFIECFRVLKKDGVLVFKWNEYDIPLRESDRRHLESQTETPRKRERIRGNTARTLAARDYKGGNNLIVRIPEATKIGYAAATVGDSINLSVPTSATPRGRVGKGIANTLDTGMQQYTLVPTGVNRPSRGYEPRKDEQASTIKAAESGSKNLMLDENYAIRRLTPRECERLQGFPDGWTEGVSDSQRYKTIGNAVTVNVVCVIIKAMTTEPETNNVS